MINLEVLWQKLLAKRKNLGPEEDCTEPFDDVRHGQSMRLLAVIDELDRLIAAETSDKAARRKLLRARASTAQQFAKHLDADPSRYSRVTITSDDNRNVWVVLEITGSPSRAGRERADKWTASRNQPWTNDVKKLRALMRQALRNGEQLPAGHFGLRVVRTIKIGHWSNDDAREFENLQVWRPANVSS
jgi:hypothetical protein